MRLESLAAALLICAGCTASDDSPPSSEGSDGTGADDGGDGSESADEEWTAIERRSRSSFNRAFERAIAALPPEDRNLLRSHIVDGLSIDRLAGSFQIHRSTAARRTAKVRETVADGVRESLVAQLGEGGAVQSVLRVVRSGLDLSLSRVLGTDDG